MHDASVRQVWLARHSSQLTHYKVPQHLYQQLYDCAHDIEGKWSDLDAVVRTRASKTSASRHKLRVETLIPLLAANKVLHVGHKWKFTSVLDAQTQLRQNENLRIKMIELIDKVLENDKSEYVVEDNQIEKEVEFILQRLPLLAYSIRFGDKFDELTHYVLDAFGSSLRENDEESNLKVIPFMCMEQQKLFSIAWTTKDVAAEAELIRQHAGKLSLMGLYKKSYWEARFETETEFDWYCEYSHLRELLSLHISKTNRILIAGTGTSRLPAEMARDGYTNVIAMDYAANVIEKMQARCQKNSWGVQFVVADLTQMMGWKSDFVDCVIDKGCLDAMLLQPETAAIETNWKFVAPVSPDDLNDAKSSMHQLARILKPNGLFFFLTFGNPSNRVAMFDWVSPQNKDVMEWEILQCLEMSPIQSQHTFVTRFYLFILRKTIRISIA
ncbi:putative methyltransferase type 11, S-adenosyl-L-methionine-dependent methyltransferase [Plasmopara halstedii]